MAVLTIKTYPDETLLALVGAASELTGTPTPDLLRAFGEFLVPDLLKIYRQAIKPEWGILDMLENAEEKMHAAVRQKDEFATPPR